MTQRRFFSSSAPPSKLYVSAAWANEPSDITLESADAFAPHDDNDELLLDRKEDPFRQHAERLQKLRHQQQQKSHQEPKRFSQSMGSLPQFSSSGNNNNNNSHHTHHSSNHSSPQRRQAPRRNRASQKLTARVAEALKRSLQGGDDSSPDKANDDYPNHTHHNNNNTRELSPSRWADSSEEQDIRMVHMMSPPTTRLTSFPSAPLPSKHHHHHNNSNSNRITDQSPSSTTSFMPPPPLQTHQSAPVRPSRRSTLSIPSIDKLDQPTATTTAMNTTTTLNTTTTTNTNVQHPQYHYQQHNQVMEDSNHSKAPKRPARRQTFLSDDGPAPLVSLLGEDALSDDDDSDLDVDCLPAPLQRFVADAAQAAPMHKPQRRVTLQPPSRMHHADANDEDSNAGLSLLAE